ncbi:MAG: UPF0280 family protein, partial [Ramlibacter sp.]
GPIDIVICADGDARAVEAAHEAAWQRFASVLDELVAELPQLRRQVGHACPVHGAIARRMWDACRPHASTFITPMAAVAGSVAQELIASYQRDGITRAWVNNGGDIALHLAPGHSLRVGLFADLGRVQSARRAPLRIDGDFVVDAAMPVRGIATSGWRGRSFSLGIADSVTVLARTAAQADAAATMVANAVNVDDPRIQRRPACELKDDTDLGDLLVTIDVPPLAPAAIHRALQAGAQRARDLQAAGLMESAVLVCQGWFTTGDGRPRRMHDVETSPAGRELLLA